MAEAPLPRLHFAPGCQDCGRRLTELPPPLPEIGDDFDWQTRDYDAFRLFLMEELAGRFPERRHWSPADLEVILVEAMAVVLDQLSDSLDRVHAEAFLDSARRPDSLRRLLTLIGYDALREEYRPRWSDPALVTHLLAHQGRVAEGLPLDLLEPDNLRRLLVRLGHDAEALGPQPSLADRDTERHFLALLGYDAESLDDALDLEQRAHRRFAVEALERHWRDHPADMEAARRKGPAAVHRNRRMVTLDDYRHQLEGHPLVLRATAEQRWTGSWHTMLATLVLVGNLTLEATPETSLPLEAFADLQASIDRFHWREGLPPVDWSLAPTGRTLLRPLLERQRLAGQEVWLQDAVPVGIRLALSLRLAPHHFHSEVADRVAERLGTGPAGYFAPGRLAFGEDLHASDLVAWLMAIDGVETVCLNRFKRVGARHPDASGSGVISLSSRQIARCDNRLASPQFGYWTLKLHGGQRG
ncbi:hypothetical protein [Halomonas sp. C05BenzN]|uniref:hypothetical protein n=1 Tax=Halomonas sp. C05BenzN TaxID=3411041 RepID=UPI003B94A6CA